ncbi:polysaccharide biosynthesis C-terminal domain-containing protein [Mesorhizobium sp.]|uniref:lipopolysaccharide biosynthesis protein n=1 Tax=Mesorhizobium sp. TaxID=1871066 RepID=UPI00257F8567|nr:polysaccharide biosynthesis C-terminal domain-containing protein [Mesorhizobium sp.]
MQLILPVLDHENRKRDVIPPSLVQRGDPTIKRRQFRDVLLTLREVGHQLVSKQLSRNSLFAVCQSFVVTLCLFLAYRIAISQVGLERLGVWSLLLAGAAVARIGDISGGGALARFVAKDSRTGRSQGARNSVHTVLLTTFGFNCALGAILWIVAPAALPHFIQYKYLGEAKLLMPFVVVSFVLSALASAVLSGVDGVQRADQRALVVSIAALVFLCSNVILIPYFGVLGFGVANILQQSTTLVLAWWALRRHIPDLGWFPWHWKRAVFAETTGYAIRLNAIGVMGLLFEPLTKFAFNHASGPALVALYELASRLVLQVRGLVIAAATPLVPAFAAGPNSDDPTFQRMLETATRLAVWAAVGVAAVTLSAAPVMSLLVLGRLSSELLQMIAALTAGWALNIVVVPSYYAAQALGVLRWNFASHALIAISVLAGIFLLVPLVGQNGIIVAIIVGLTLSMLTVLFGNAHALGTAAIVRRLRWQLLTASAAVSLLALAAWILAGLVGL